MRKIVCMQELAPHQMSKLRQAVPGWELVAGDAQDLNAHLPEAEILAGWSGRAAEVCLGPDSQLRWVQAWGAGVDQMPFDTLRRKGIILTNASGVHAYPISETVFGMMLAFTRQLHRSIRNQEQKKWEWLGGLEEIHNKVMGLVGTGAIGEETARLAQAFGMRVLGMRKSGADCPHVDRMYDLGGLDEMLRQSDFVVVTLPLTPETEHLMDGGRFRVMKPSAFFVNIGRGRTVDTEALIAALRDGTIAGAGLDVFEQEPLPVSSPLWEMPNVIITPHNSGNTVHYDDRAVEIFAENLRDYIAGKVPSRNRVDLEKGY